MDGNLIILFTTYVASKAIVKKQIRVTNLTLFVACAPHPVPEHGSVTCDGNPVQQGGSCHFSCDPGFDLLGFSSDTCVNGKWSKETPTCYSKQTQTKLILFALFDLPRDPVKIISYSSSVTTGENLN